MAFMVLIDKITKALENGEFIIGVFLYFSKAFDTVNHEILLYKLSHYGIRVPRLSGSGVTWEGDLNMLHTMVLNLLKRLLNVVYPRDLS